MSSCARQFAVAALFTLALPSAVSLGQPMTVTHFAGGDGGPGAIDASGAAARFRRPRGLAADAAGNVYVADAENYVIRKITPAGEVMTLAGLAGEAGDADGPGSVARFYGSRDVAADANGNVYVADTANHTIRKITPSGVVTTLAGRPQQWGSADGRGSQARFYNPQGIAVGPDGSVFVADSWNSTIRKITPDGQVTTFAGLAGEEGSANGTGSAARFDFPAGVAVASNGDVYVSDTGNHTIRRITPAGVVTTFAGSVDVIGSADGTGSAALFNGPLDLAIDSGNDLYVSDSSNHTVRRITSAAVVTTIAGSAGFAGTDDGTGSAARFTFPEGVAVHGSTVYVGDSLNHVIRRIESSVVTTFAGTPFRYFLSNDGTGAGASFEEPRGIVAAGSDLYVSDTGNRTIRKITSAGVVTTVAGTAGAPGSTDGTGAAARFDGPHGIAVSGGELYVADSNNHTIRKVTTSGVVTTFAGSPGLIGSDNGTGSEARFAHPRGVAADGSGNLFVAEWGNNVIRKITSGGGVTTFAGTPGPSGSADGTGSAASFYGPQGVVVDTDGTVYVADSGNHTIRKITSAGVVTTLAGQPGAADTVDGTGSDARFWAPSSLTLSGGDLYVADTGRHVIRRVTLAGVVTTVAGRPQPASGIDDGVGINAGFFYPQGITAVSGGTLYVADSSNHRIRKLRPTLADSAMIDSSSGVTGAPRQLSTSPQTATEWQWRVIRRPAGSTAALASPAAASSTFTPDVADRFDFRLFAASSAGATFSDVSLVATCGTTPATPGIVSSANPSIAGDTVTLDAGPGYDAYVWSTGDGTRTIEIAPQSTTQYTVTGFLGACPSDEAEHTQTVQPIAPPANLTATATSTTSVQLSWTGPANAVYYEIWRSSGGAAFVQIDTSATTGFTDSVATGTTYIYKLRAVDAGPNYSSYSSPDYATTIGFTDQTLVAGVTRIKGLHLTELRTAVNAVRTAAGLSAAVFTDPTVSSTLRIKAVHVTELRGALAAARTAIGVAAVTYTNATLTPSVSRVKAVDVQEIRTATQ